MKLLFTICGRAGSKGIKNKNIRDFLGKPLPLYSLSAIHLFLKRNLEYDADIALNTDSEELKEIMRAQAIEHIQIVERKSELAGDLVGKIDVINDTLLQMEKRNRCIYDMVIDLDITSPLRTVEDIERLIDKKKKSGCDVVFSVAESRRNPYFNMLIKTEHGYKKVLNSVFTARQQAPEIFDINASLYAYDPDYLRTGKGILDGYCEIIQMYDTGILDLDRTNDFELMEVIADYLYKSKKEFGEIRNFLVYENNEM